MRREMKNKWGDKKQDKKRGDKTQDKKKIGRQDMRQKKWGDKT